MNHKSMFNKDFKIALLTYLYNIELLVSLRFLYLRFGSIYTNHTMRAEFPYPNASYDCDLKH